jgi:hypothetical protein
VDRFRASRLDLRWVTLLVLAFLLVWAGGYVRLARVPADPDQFWHIETGRYIVQHHAVPSTDVFSWYGRMRGASWMAQEWLFGVIAFGLHSLGGFKLLYAFTALLDALMFLLAYALSLARSRNRTLSFAIATLAVLGTYGNLASRPQMITFCLLLAIALLGEKKMLWWAVPLVVLGANVHGGAYPIYLVVVAFYALPEQPAVLAACAAAVLLNPRGAALLPYPLGIANPDAVFIQEFQPTALASRPIDAIVYFTTLLLMWQKRVRFKDGLFALALIALSLTAIRQVAFFYVLALPVLAPYLLAPRLGAAERQPRAKQTPPPIEPLPRHSLAREALASAPLAVLAVMVAAFCVVAARQPLEVAKGYPAGAAAFVRANHLDRVWNLWQDGGYLISVGVPPLVDGRGDPFMAAANHGVDLAHDYFTTYALEQDPRAFFDRYGIRNLIVGKRTGFYAALVHDPALRTLYADSAYAVMQYGGTASASTARATP